MSMNTDPRPSAPSDRLPEPEPRCSTDRPEEVRSSARPRPVPGKRAVFAEHRHGRIRRVFRENWRDHAAPFPPADERSSACPAAASGDRQRCRRHWVQRRSGSLVLVKCRAHGALPSTISEGSTFVASGVLGTPLSSPPARSSGAAFCADTDAGSTNQNHRRRSAHSVRKTAITSLSQISPTHDLPPSDRVRPRSHRASMGGEGRSPLNLGRASVELL